MIKIKQRTRKAYTQITISNNDGIKQRQPNKSDEKNHKKRSNNDKIIENNEQFIREQLRHTDWIKRHRKLY